jgi:hypothetical protein
MRRKRIATPQLTDAHLAALLMFLHGASPDDRGGRNGRQFAHADQAAQAMLTSYPLTSAFGVLLDRPVIYDEVAAALRADVPLWTNPKDTRRALEAIEDARNEKADAAVKANDIRDLLPAYIDSAVLVGACLMYRLLKGGER